MQSNDEQRLDIAWMPAGAHELLLRTDTPHGLLSKFLRLDVTDVGLLQDVEMNFGYRVKVTIDIETADNQRGAIGRDFTVRFQPFIGPPLMPPTREDGSVYLEYVPEGVYKLSFTNLPRAFHVRSIKDETGDMLTDYVKIDKDTTINVIVSIVNGTLSGSVLNSKNEKAPFGVVAST